jgi:hypothetical protein
MGRPYAAGAAILLTLLLSAAIGAQVEWVYIGGVEEVTSPAMEVPAGAALASPVAVQATPPEQGSADGMPLDYIYLFDSGTGGNYIPWWGQSYTACKAQYLYLASEINKAGSIAQLGLFKNFYAGYYNTFQNTSVKLCHTTITTLTTSFTGNYTGNTPVWVYHGNLSRGMPTAGLYDTLDLTTYFAYNGTQNLIVEVLWSGRTSAVGIPSYTGNMAGRRCYRTGDTLNTGTGVDGAVNACRLGFLGQPDDVGVTKIITPAEPFYAFGDTFYMQAEVKNFGIAAQTGVKVRCRIQDKVSSATIYHETLFVDLAVGQTDTVDFPGFYAPPAVEAAFVDTIRTELPGDQAPSNDWKANELKVT